ncbi:PilZ domain-containing protein [Colwelliaceae bacterium 6471]
MTDADKLEQFNEFFSIEHKFNVNLIPVENAHSMSYEQFIQSMPLPFKMAGDIISIDQAALRPLQGITGVAGQLVDFLNYQSQKIDLLVNYVLSQQDDEKYRFNGIKFGGGGVIFSASNAFELNQMFEVKIFLLEDNCAVFCHGEVIAVEEKDGDYLHKLIFHHIREEDREILVRTSLHQQSKQLQALSTKRNQSIQND